MKKYQKAQAKQHIEALSKLHEEIRENLERNSLSFALEQLASCQEKAIELGNFIEEAETAEGNAENVPVVPCLEEYCEIVFSIYQELQDGSENNPRKVLKRLNKALIKADNSLRNDIKVRREAVFFPYKASMWDSLESVWRAADADPDCDAYVVPIPYYDKNPDGSFKQMHYEGNQYPKDVPVTDYRDYDLETHHPDMIFIHSPYDGMNLVTSIEPAYYSDKLKQHTDCLVYIPYFATAGGMSEGQSLCPAYMNVDYIVIQSEKHRKFYDGRIPDKKFLALGSPKFDSVIGKCKNPPEPLAEWKEKMAGRKVYFYNTSIGGMLGNTDAFLNKMEYVFKTFQENPEACLLWRPHPLLESTFDSMRPQHRARFDALKKRYMEEAAGIYDDTPSIENAVALSDAYVGDSGTSVTSLFGVAGKPQFILNNYIHEKPAEDDWRGEIIQRLNYDGDNRWLVTQGNKLWHSEGNDYHYKFYCDLTPDCSGGNYYCYAKQIGDAVYALPNSAQDILVLKNGQMKRAALKKEIRQPGAFNRALYTERYIFLIPFRYPKLVRFDVKTEQIVYMDGVRDFLVRDLNGEKVIGASRLVKNELVLASPTTADVLFIDMETLKVRNGRIPGKDMGTAGIVPHGTELWLLPLNGTAVRRWNPETDEAEEYAELPEGFSCLQFPLNYECAMRPFGNAAVVGDKVILSPLWGNMYAELDTDTGKMKRWNPPPEITQQMRGKSGYYITGGMGGFTFAADIVKERFLWDAPERKLYRLDAEMESCTPVDIYFDRSELLEHEPGFRNESEWLLYCCKENAFQSLDGFLKGNVKGNPHDREKQLEAYLDINASPDGDCGQKVYRFLKEEGGLW